MLLACSHAGAPAGCAPVAAAGGDRARRPQPGSQPRGGDGARKVDGRQAQRGSAAVFQPSRFRDLCPGWAAAADHDPAGAGVEGARAVPAAPGPAAYFPDRPRGPRQRPGRQLAAEDARGAAASPDPHHDRGKRLRPAAHHPLPFGAVPVHAAFAGRDGAVRPGARSGPARAARGAGGGKPRRGRLDRSRRL